MSAAVDNRGRFRQRSGQNSRSKALVVTMAGLILLCINPAITQGSDNKNLLLAAVMCLSPLVLLFRDARVFIPRIDIPLTILCLSIVSTPLLFHSESIRAVTMLFTLACSIYFMMLARVIRIARMSSGELLALIRWIVYAFFIMLVIQQVCVVAEWPVINVSHYFPDRGGLSRFKLNSLSAEASHTSFTLGILMYFYTQIFITAYPGNAGKCFTRQIGMWAAYFWVIFSTVNASAYVFGLLFLIPLINRKTAAPIAGITICCMMIFLVCTPVMQNKSFMRVQKLMFALPTLDEQKIMDADLSASCRIVPSIRGCKALAAEPDKLLTGHGVDADSRDIPVVAYGVRSGAGIFKAAYNYGLIAALSIWSLIAIVTIVPGKPVSWLTALIALTMSGEYNLQLFWVVLAFAMAYKSSAVRKSGLFSS
ncbi:MAG: hypothetical protein NC204_01160 [Candidatus Amulumruptor caecigallinarius]|nr:hypothetical protein [Candidatus Amulumruptor caecigallinarius]